MGHLVLSSPLWTLVSPHQPPLQASVLSSSSQIVVPSPAAAGINWDLVRNVTSRMPPQIYGLRNPGGASQHHVLSGALQVTRTHGSFRTTAIWPQPNRKQIESLSCGLFLFPKWTAGIGKRP